MIDQEAHDVAASVEHLMTQRGTDARSWQRQAEAHEATLIGLREEIADLTRLVSTETPIAAFDLATTWKATEAHLWDEIAELRQQLAVAVEDAGIARTERDGLARQVLALVASAGYYRADTDWVLVSRNVLDSLPPLLERAAIRAQGEA